MCESTYWQIILGVLSIAAVPQQNSVVLNEKDPRNHVTCHACVITLSVSVAVITSDHSHCLYYHSVNFVPCKEAFCYHILTIL